MDVFQIHNCSICFVARRQVCLGGMTDEAVMSAKETENFNGTLTTLSVLLRAQNRGPRIVPWNIKMDEKDKVTLCVI